MTIIEFVLNKWMAITATSKIEKTNKDIKMNNLNPFYSFQIVLKGLHRT